MRVNPTKRKRRARQTACESPKTFFAYAILVDQIYNENAEEGTEPGDPIREGGMHGYWVIRLVVRWVRMCGENDGIQIPRENWLKTVVQMGQWVKNT
jgi:hypothetical protein